MRVILNYDEATYFLKNVIIAKLGQGYHPDTPLSDYVNLKTGQPTFTELELSIYEPMHLACSDLLGEVIYAVTKGLCDDQVQP